MAQVTIPAEGYWSTLSDLINANFDELYYQSKQGWVDLLANLNNASGLPAAAQPDNVLFADNGAGSTGIYAKAFSATIIENLLVTFHIPHGIADEIIYPHIHWAPSNTNTGVVRWGIEYVYAKGYEQQAFGNTSIIYIEQAATGTTKQHQITETADPGITVSGLETDGLLVCRIFRDATHANDTYNADAFGLYCDLHVQQDRRTTPNRNYPFD